MCRFVYCHGGCVTELWPQVQALLLSWPQKQHALQGGPAARSPRVQPNQVHLGQDNVGVCTVQFCMQVR